MQLNGQRATANELLARFPAGAGAVTPELEALKAADEILRGSADDGQSKLELAARGMASLPLDRKARFEVSLAILRLLLATRVGNLPAVVEEAESLLAPAEAAGSTIRGAGDDIRAVAATNLGIAELWLNRVEQAERHLELGVALARKANHPYLEVSALA